MNIARSVEAESPEKRSTRSRPGVPAAEPAVPSALTGPAAFRPAALLQRQAVLGNAHTGRIFRSPAAAPEAAGSDQKKECSCGGGEECTCPK